MRGIARLNDRTFGTCSHPSHRTPIQVGGKIVTASGNTSVNSRAVARLGDTVLTDCGHTSKIITASPTATANGQTGVARINDKVGAGPYVANIITASGNTDTN